jgi:hypothetical protein
LAELEGAAEYFLSEFPQFNPETDDHE